MRELMIPIAMTLVSIITVPLVLRAYRLNQTKILERD